MDAADLDAILSSVRTFVRERVMPREDEIEDTDAFPADLRDQAAAMGLFGFAIPEEHGGLGLTVEEQVRVVIELGYTSPALRSLVGTNNGIAGHVLLEGGTEQQKAEWLPKLASGEVLAAFGLSEPDAGSDPSALTTKAVRDGDEWVITGTKRYITNSVNGDVIFVFARTVPDAPPTRGIANLIVPAGTPGLTIGPKDRKMGQAGAWSADVILDEARVPHANLIGGDDGITTGFGTAMRCLAHGRLHIAALSVGIAERAVDEMVAWAQNRVQGGRPIAQHQLVQGLVADSVTELHAGRALVLDAARRYDQGTDRRMGPATAKYFCSEMAGRVTDRCVQVHGGAGYIRGVAAERLYRHARLLRIYEGTSQIQQTVIARAVLGDAAR
jgi:acyl-CoA dehydrogenase